MSLISQNHILLDLFLDIVKNICTLGLQSYLDFDYPAEARRINISKGVKNPFLKKRMMLLGTITYFLINGLPE